ncbi:hypothetical protein [Photobacterium kishitanii]|uniref:Uncharacterized protein n=1 Tax=Photobacterium kishitanii TaxID=318456 RepID=A0A2T3KMR0_9GAMM|nr:hypothetical protein [Photobacterium kishitanii]PSV01068.1 hypothetical protein C9J27_03355 [Photobacterium kishitanii]
MAEYKVVGQKRVELRPRQCFCCWGFTDSDDKIAIVSTPVYMTGEFVCSICLLDPEIDKCKEDVFDTIQRRQNIQFKVNLARFAASKGLTENYFDRHSLKDAKSKEFRLLVDACLADLWASVRSFYSKKTDGTLAVDMEAFCNSITEMENSGFSVIAYPLKNPELLKNAVSSRSRFNGLVGKKKKRQPSGNNVTRKTLVVDNVTSEVITERKNFEFTKLMATFKNEIDGSLDTSTSEISYNINPRVYFRKSDDSHNGKVFVNLAFLRKDGSSPNFKSNSAIELECPLEYDFSRAKRDAAYAESRMIEIKSDVGEKISKAFKGSFDGTSYLPIHNRGGFADRLSAMFGTDNVNIKMKQAEVIPVAFAIKAMEEQGYMEKSHVHTPKIDSTGQNVLKLPDGMEVRTTELSRAQKGYWSKRTPDQWLAQNRAGIFGRTREFLTYVLSSKIGDTPMVSFPSAVDGYMENVEAMSKTVDLLTEDVKRYLRLVGLKSTSFSGDLDKMSIRPRRPCRTYSDNIDIADYMLSRGITKDVMDYVMSTGRVYYGTLENNVTGAFFDCGKFGFSYEDKKNRPISVQRFLKKRDGSVTKLFLANALANGSAHEISTTGTENNIVLTEAIVDAYSYLSLVNMTGGDITDYRLCSLNSANYTHEWFSGSFGVCPPKDGVDYGLLVDIQKEYVSDFDFSSYFSDAFTYVSDDGVKSFEQIEFIHDGTAISDKSLSLLVKMAEVGGVSDRISVIKDEQRLSGHYANSDIIVFDKTNVYSSLTSNGIEFNQSEGCFVKFNNIEKLTPIETEVQRLKARSRIIDKVGHAKFILAYDNDTAGVSKSIDVFNLLSYLEIPVSVAMVPFESKNDNSISHSNALERVKNMGADINLGFNEHTLLNDVNDILKKYTKLVEAGNAAGAKTLAESFLSQANDGIKANQDKLSDMDLITTELQTLTKVIRLENSQLFNMVKELGIASSSKREAEAKGNKHQAASYRDVQVALYKNIRAELNALSSTTAYHVKTDKNFKEYATLESTAKDKVQHRLRAQG